MTVGPLPHVAPVSAGSARRRSRLARWAVGLSLICGAMIMTSILIAVTCKVAGVDTAGMGVLLTPGVPGAAVAFVLATIARARGERWQLLRLPLALFPATALYLVLAEALLWE